VSFSFSLVSELKECYIFLSSPKQFTDLSTWKSIEKDLPYARGRQAAGLNRD
jgi:hypothetical protein